MLTPTRLSFTRWPRAASVVVLAFALVGVVAIALGQDTAPDEPTTDNNNGATRNNGLSAEAGDREVDVPIYAVRVLPNAPQTTARVRALPGEFGPTSRIVARVAYEIGVHPDGFEDYVASAKVDFSNADASARDWWTREIQLGTPAPGKHVLDLPVTTPGTFWVQFTLRPRQIEVPGNNAGNAARNNAAAIPGTVAESQRFRVEAVTIKDSAITLLPVAATAVATRVRYAAVPGAGARRIQLDYDLAVAVDPDVAARNAMTLTVTSNAAWGSGGTDANPLLRNLRPNVRDEKLGSANVPHHALDGWQPDGTAEGDGSAERLTIARRDDGALLLHFRLEASVPTAAQSEWVVVTDALSIASLDRVPLPPELANWRAEIIVTAQLFGEPPGGRSVFTGRVDGVATPIELEMPFRFERAEEVVE